jgi:membrane protease YdiL (CAAX protease family)
MREFLQSMNPGPVIGRVLLFVLLLVAFIATIETLALVMGLIVPSKEISTRNLLVSKCIEASCTLFAAWILSRLEGRRLGEYGLPWLGAPGKLFLQGAVFGVAEIGAIVGVLSAAGYYSFGSLEVHGASFVEWALFWAIFFVIVAFVEEYGFRGYIQFALTKGFGFWPATIVTSVIFGVVHLSNPGESWPGILGVVAVGIFWCFTLRRTGSLWFAFGMHAAFDFGETFLFSVPDSGFLFPGHLSSAVIRSGPAWLVGGTAGPEASVLDFLMLAIFFFLVHKMYPEKPELPTAIATSATNSASEFALSIETPSVTVGGENQRTNSEA